MPRLEIGIGILLAVAAAFDLLTSIEVNVFLILAGILLVLYGTYDEFIKPRIRWEQRLSSWMQQRGWQVGIERQPQFAFLLKVRADGSEKDIVITQDKKSQNNTLAFTAKVGLDPMWLPALAAMPDKERRLLITDIRLYLTGKDLGFALDTAFNNRINWPPSVVIQHGIPQDRSLSPYAVDIAAKKVEVAMIGVRDLIRRAIITMPAPAAQVVETTAAQQPPPYASASEDVIPEQYAAQAPEPERA